MIQQRKIPIILIIVGIIFYIGLYVFIQSPDTNTLPFLQTNTIISQGMADTPQRPGFEDILNQTITSARIFYISLHNGCPGCPIPCV